MPYQSNSFAFFYNADIFKAAGVNEVPATWDELPVAYEKSKKDKELK
ncbi:extracellular solute-binding protein [Anaerobium acetethylicum]